MSLDLWMEEMGIAPNTSVARRWIVEGRVFVNHVRVTDIAHEVSSSNDTVEVMS